MSIFFKQRIDFPFLKTPYVLIIDRDVHTIFHHSLRSLVSDKRCLLLITLKSGEKIKDLKTLHQIFQQFHHAAIAKNTTLIAIGGGTILDVAGLVASLWMRGINWFSVPTTVLAQADSCLGGKTAINFLGRKNLLGSFYPPQKIFLFQEFIEHLPFQLHLEGASEIYKHALLKNDLKLLRNLHVVLDKKSSITSASLKKSLAIKKHFVKKDFLDQLGQRVFLNLGHTLGHTLEQLHPALFSHGRAIWWGIFLEAHLLGYYHQLNSPLWQNVLHRALEHSANFHTERRFIKKNILSLLTLTLGDKKNSSSPNSLLITMIYVIKPGRVTLKRYSLEKLIQKIHRLPWERE